MFDNLFGGQDSSSPIDVLNSLISPDNVAMKTDLNMTQIKILVRLKWFSERRKPENKNKDPMETFTEKVIPYYLELMVSLKRKSREEIIKGISELKSELLQTELMMQGLIGGGKK